MYVSLERMVIAFQNQHNQPIRDHPVLSFRTGPKEVYKATKLIQLELSELNEAFRSDDIEGVADGIGGLIYLLARTAVQLGYPLDKVLAEAVSWPAGSS